jgi:hypothetical protein
MLRFIAAGLASCALLQSARGAQAQPAVAVQYHLAPVPRSPAELGKLFTADQIGILEKLNRRDRDHLLRVEPAIPGLILPDTWIADELAYSPFPAAYAWAEPYAKAIVVHQPSQAFGAYEAGRLVRWGPVSTGRKDTPTPAGAYNLTWRAKGRRSTDNAAWFLPWYFNFHNERGVSFHQFDLPGYPASHACVRLLERDAVWLYGWGEQWTLDPTDRRKIITPGSPVLILGTFEYGVPVPWTDPAFHLRTIQLPEP